jgi:hypothetical protein
MEAPEMPARLTLEAHAVLSPEMVMAHMTADTEPPKRHTAAFSVSKPQALHTRARIQASHIAQ